MIEAVLAAAVATKANAYMRALTAIAPKALRHADFPIVWPMSLSLLRFIPERLIPDFYNRNPQFLVSSPVMEVLPGHQSGNGNGVAHANGNGLTPTHANGNGHLALANGNGSGAALPVDWESLARSTAHPLRVSILEILGLDGGRVLSPSDLSIELQIPLSNTNYHVTELAKGDLIELVGQRQVRGATEHFYRLPAAKHAAYEPLPSRETSAVA